MKKRDAWLMVSVGLLLAGGAGWYTQRHLHRQKPSYLARLVEQVPAAKSVTAFRGAGFKLSRSGPIESDQRPLPNVEPARTLVATAPAHANEPFVVGSLGSKNPGRLSLQGAAPSNAVLDHGALLYPSAYPGTDVLVTRDPSRFELAYVVNDPAHAPAFFLNLAVTGAGRQELRHEPGTPALVLYLDGHPHLRLESPVALDARGATRGGTYEVDGRAVRIAMNLDGLTPPIVVDPAIAIPYWTILSDARVPGAQSYDSSMLSHETHIQMDSGRGKAVLLRPTRTQQPEDHLWALWPTVSGLTQVGTATRENETGLDGTSPTHTPDLLREHRRTVLLESETWEWDGWKWTLTPALGLPGWVDPSTAYDSSRQRLVAQGGIMPRFTCAGESYQCTLRDPYVNSTFEYDGSAWTEKKLAGAPPPRLRGAMAALGSKTLLFGGRKIAIGDFSVNTGGVFPYGPPFPEMMTHGLLNDTWIYDGTRWDHPPVQHPPPPMEAATLVADEARGRWVLLPGPGETGADSFGIWEFDGTDWIERIRPNDAALPVALRGRTGVAAFWHATRHSTVLFGGNAQRFASCTLEGSALTSAIAAATNDSTLHEQLVQQGCLGGYGHDAWEWNGTALSQLTQVAFGGYDKGRAVFRQLASSPWVALAPSPTVTIPPTLVGLPPLLPWRNDSRQDHFPLRSTLERAHAPQSSSAISDPAGAPVSLPSVPGGGSGTPTFVSPLFAASERPNVTFDAGSGYLSVFSQHDGRIFATNGSDWSDRTPAGSPFGTGPNDFFGATWDTATQHIVLFDPITAATWTYGDGAGWQRLEVTGGPPIWSVDPSVRQERDLEPPDPSARPVDVSRFENAALQMPVLAFDRHRSVTAMLYDHALWELSSTTWVRHPGPPGWENCEAARLIAFDGARNRIVAVGCTVPGGTWEWDGTSWLGPYAGPYQDLVDRNERGVENVGPECKATLQFAWAHPNALFETEPLRDAGGGVGIIDTGGTLRVWNGTQWTAGPPLPQKNRCGIVGGLLDGVNPQSAPVVVRDDFYDQLDTLPMCFSPPMVNDRTHSKVLGLGDTVLDMTELRYATPAYDFKWSRTPLGATLHVAPNTCPEGEICFDQAPGLQIHPGPFELGANIQVYLKMKSDPATRACNNDKVTKSEFWPLRFLADAVTGRIRVLTHRGVVWELGGEMRRGLGEHCESQSDCGGSFCDLTSGVCCNEICSYDDSTDGGCRTCNGKHPGLCETQPDGEPGQCNGPNPGECIRTCQNRRCVFAGGQPCGPAASCQNGMITQRGTCGVGTVLCNTPQPAACANGLGCLDATACKTTCVATADCSTPFTECSPDRTHCQPDATSSAATARGITPSTWQPAKRRTPNEVADLLKSLGFHQAANGSITFDGYSPGGLTLAFNPNLKTPVTGHRACLAHILACDADTDTADACVAAMPRCTSTTPWMNDPAGFDCCPQECLLEYLNDRTTMGADDALIELSRSRCYPGLTAYLQELQ